MTTTCHSQYLGSSLTSKQSAAGSSPAGVLLEINRLTIYSSLYISLAGHIWDIIVKNWVNLLRMSGQMIRSVVGIPTHQLNRLPPY